MIKSALVALCIGASAASASVIAGFGIEADYYTPVASGNFAYKGISTQFADSEDTVSRMGGYFEHPVPVLPNLRVDWTSKSTFGNATSAVSYSQLDVTPYYEILDNVVDLDIGVTFKVLEGNVIGSTNQSFKEVIPMGYLGAGLVLPGLPISFAGSVKYIGLDGDSFTDARVKAMFDIAAGVQAQVGYRYESLRLNDRFGITADATFEGPFAGIGFNF